ncbi:hypothetical protein Tco_0265910 [Tanacetum coccineum]
MRRQGKNFSRRETPLFPSTVVQAQEQICEGSAMPTDPHHTPIITQPSSSQPRRKQKSRRPKEKDTQAPQFSVPSDLTNVANEAINEEPSMQLKELMNFCTKLQQRVLNLENTKTAQAQEITSLKLRVKKLEKKRGSRTHKLKRLYRAGRFARVVSSEEASLGDQEDASNKGRKFIYDSWEKAPTSKEANIAWDDFKAKIDLTINWLKELLCTEQQERKEEQATYKGSIKVYHVYLPEEYGKMEAQRLKEQSWWKATGTRTKVLEKQKEVAVDAIPLATKPPSIVDWKIVKEGKISYYQIIRSDGSSKRGDYERVLWGDLKTMFEHHIEDAVWRNLRESKVLVWKLFDSCKSTLVSVQNLHVFYVVENRYPLHLLPSLDMLNKKQQADHWNESVTSS